TQPLFQRQCSGTLPWREQRWRSRSLERSFTRSDEELQQAPSLLTTGHHEGQQPLGKSTPRLASGPEAALAPQHGRPQGPLGYIVGGLDPVHPSKGPQRRPPLRQLSAQGGRFPVGVLLAAPR